MWKNLTSLALIFGLIAVAVGRDAAQLEAQSFIKIGDGYYYFHRETKHNWFEAFASCRRMNASLVSFETIEEYHRVAQPLEVLKDTRRYWVSSNSLAKEGQHVWLATGKPVNIKIWAPHQPDQPDRERCEMINYRYKPEDKPGMNDATCYGMQHYICEADLF